MRNDQPSSHILRFLRKPFSIIRANLRVYLIINAGVYGLVIIGFILAMIFPALGASRVASLEGDGSADLARSLFSQPWLFALVIFGVNVFTVGALNIVLPSLLIPFAGVGIFAYRAFTLGAVLAPSTDIAAVGLIPHSLTALIEFQAYSLLVFGAFLLARSWIWPSTAGASNRRRGYLGGLRQLGWLSLPALALFIIGAIWEAFSLRYLVYPLTELLL